MTLKWIEACCHTEQLIGLKDISTGNWKPWIEGEEHPFRDLSNAYTDWQRTIKSPIGPKPTPIGKLGEVLGDAGFDSRHSKYGSKRKLPGKERCLWNLWQKDAGDGQR